VTEKEEAIRHPILYSIILTFITVALIGACSPAASQSTQPAADASVEAQVKELQKELAIVSAIAAYHIWWDQYYNYSKGYYAFPSAEAFNKRLGGLVYATSDSNAIKSWENYLVADKNSNAVIQSLPKEPAKWTTEEYNKWVKAYTVRVNALGEVGTALHNIIAKQ